MGHRQRQFSVPISLNFHRAVVKSASVGFTLQFTMNHPRAFGTSHPRVARHMTRLLWHNFGLGTCLMLAFFSAMRARGETRSSPPEQERFDEAEQLYEEKKYVEAAVTFESLGMDFLNSPLLFAANLKAAAGYFSAGLDVQGVAALRRNLHGENVPGDIVEQSRWLLAQRLQSLAQKVQPGTSEAHAGFTKAIEQYEIFLRTFPHSQGIEQANLGMAQCCCAIGRYDDAARLLQENLTGFPVGQFTAATYDLLAQLISAQDVKPALIQSATMERPGKPHADSQLTKSAKQSGSTGDAPSNFTGAKWSALRMGSIACGLFGGFLVIRHLRRLRNGKTYQAFYFGMLQNEAVYCLRGHASENPLKAGCNNVAMQRNQSLPDRHPGGKLAQPFQRFAGTWPQAV